ncbi:metallophosphoesterase [Massilia sp. ZL223]|uniref:metallophosphoesterase n=1 Tax=Massilia sp. ZL223 TaxID=2824904 RepID=UPI001B81C893|nr:metallophosphoesterase [Massilia sp. ZL223]MBQ5965131.1 metallophosphoesterase [Massilia sp. ZL223]
MDVHLFVRAAALLACALAAGCGSLARGPAPADEPAFVVLGPDGEARARLVTRERGCPEISVDGRAVPMAVRVPYGAIPSRPGADPVLAGAPSSAVLTCEQVLPAGVRTASVRGQPLALPVPAPRRIVVLGDTGCRLKKSSLQDCNDPDSYPFVQVAAAAAAWKPDLVIHVGDYHYREDPCPPGRAGCAGSPWGYGWDAWRADFFAPGAALLRAAPWVMTRGNHESCARAGQGWWRYLDPRPFEPGRDCDLPAGDARADHAEPYAVPLGGGAQLIVFDTSNTSWRGLPESDPRRARYRDTWREIARLAQGAAYNIGVDHHPLFAFGASQDAKTGKVSLFGGDKGLLDAFGDMDRGYLPASVSMLLSGHVHLWEQLSFSSRHPTQLVSGFSGTAEDTLPLPAVIPPGTGPAPGAVVEHFSSWVDGFGFMTLERSGAASWEVGVWDRHGRQRNRCTVEGSKSRCELGQVTGE